MNTPAEITRKSIALYYYTASKKVYEDTPAHSTMYVAHPNDAGSDKRQAIRLRIDNDKKGWLPPVALRALARIRRRKKA